MMLKEMLKRTRCDGQAKVLIFRAAPPPDEGPYRLGLRFDERSNREHCLPTWIPLPLGRSTARKNGFGLSDCLLHSHWLIRLA